MVSDTEATWIFHVIRTFLSFKSFRNFSVTGSANTREEICPFKNFVIKIYSIYLPDVAFAWLLQQGISESLQIVSIH